MDGIRYRVRVRNGIHLCDQLAKVQYGKYGMALKALIVLSGLAVISAGALMPVTRLWKGILIVLGGWLAISYNYPFVIMSERHAAAQNFQFPPLEYAFDETGVTQIVEGRDFDVVLPYSEIQYLIEDELCFYFFMYGRSGHILLKEGFKPGEYEGFRGFMEEKTGLKIQRRNMTGLQRTSLRFRNGLESRLENTALFGGWVEGRRMKRAERDERFRQKEAERQKELELERLEMEKQQEREQSLHDMLKADPKKMEEFKMSVHREKKSRRKNGGAG